jgi:sugar phosphate isomerase/epimerase
MESEMAWKYSVFTVMCPELDLEKTAALAASLGFDGLEWRVTKKPPEPIEKTNYWSGNRSTVDVGNIDADLKRAKAIADRHGLAMPVLGTYMACSDLATVEAVMRAANSVGSVKMRVGPPRYDGKQPYPVLYEQTIRDYGKVAALARKYKVQACIEMHMGNITPSAGLAHRLVSNFDPAEIGVIFDPGNMVVEGMENFKMGLELLGPYLSHVHAKNMAWAKTGEKDGVAQWERQMVQLKKGQADWTEVVAALKSVGYDGWLSFEDFSDVDTRTKLSDALVYLKELEAAPSR